MHDYKSKEIWEHELGRGEEQGEKQGQTLLKRSAAEFDNLMVWWFDSILNGAKLPKSLLVICGKSSGHRRLKICTLSSNINI